MGSNYQIYKDITGKYRFRLRAANNKIIAVSEAYESKAGCINGVMSVQKNCSSHIEDKTIEAEKMSNPKYEVFTDIASNCRFNLKAANGEIITASEGYETKQGVMAGIEAVQNSCDSEMEDLTVDQEIKDKQLSEAVEKSCYSVVTPEDITYTPYTPVEVCKEPPEGVNATSIALSTPPTPVDSGSSVIFRGKLIMTESGEGLGCVMVHIFEQDRSFLRDDLLTFGPTEPDGTFIIDWIDKQRDFWDDKIQVYAKFIGTENYLSSKSEVHPMKVLWHAKKKE